MERPWFQVVDNKGRPNARSRGWWAGGVGHGCLIQRDFYNNIIYKHRQQTDTGTPTHSCTRHKQWPCQKHTDYHSLVWFCNKHHSKVCQHSCYSAAGVYAIHCHIDWAFQYKTPRFYCYTDRRIRVAVVLKSVFVSSKACIQAVHSLGQTFWNWNPQSHSVTADFYCINHTDDVLVGTCNVVECHSMNNKKQGWASNNAAILAASQCLLRGSK